MNAGRYFDDVNVGDRGTSDFIQITDLHIRLYSELSEDRTPIHLDDKVACDSIFGKRVAHGLLGLSVTDGLKTKSSLQFQPGAALSWKWDFLAPIFINDRIKVEFEVKNKRETRKQGWGIVVLEVYLTNQDNQTVQQGEHTLMVPKGNLHAK